MKHLHIQMGVVAWCLAASGGLWAQSTSLEPAKPAEFPAGATVPTAAELSGTLANKVWQAQFANGQKARYQFKGDYLYVDLSSGASDTGKWSVEDGRLCAEFRRFNSGCSDVRMQEGKVWFKRASNGEIVGLTVD